MEDSIVRIEKVIIQNFKNVAYGEVLLINPKKPDAASILGLYGQNGSGKTALIDAVQLLKLALCGKTIPGKYGEYIHVNTNEAIFSYVIKVEDAENGDTYKAYYSFKIRKNPPVIAEENFLLVEQPNREQGIELFDEKLSCSFTHGYDPSLNEPKQNVIDTITDQVFLPRKKYNLLVGKSKNTYTDLLVAKKLALSTGRSFVFSPELKKAVATQNPVPVPYQTLLENLRDYGNHNLFAITSANGGDLSLNALPLRFAQYNEESNGYQYFSIPLENVVTIPKDSVTIVEKALENMNILLVQLVPELKIGVSVLQYQTLANGKIAADIQLVSKKNGKDIPLRVESDGIKKIISILQLLIAMYNNPSMTIAIDELDAGVFEYLLGELLRILSEKGEGQLIFTAHNLRTLETLDKTCVAFTTTNPQNRYIHLSNRIGKGNLRDFYYRDIVLGEQEEEVYAPTNNHEISLAFREAGEYIGS